MRDNLLELNLARAGEFSHIGQSVELCDGSGAEARSGLYSLRLDHGRGWKCCSSQENEHGRCNNEKTLSEIPRITVNRAASVQRCPLNESSLPGCHHIQDAGLGIFTRHLRVDNVDIAGPIIVSAC
jgi:hypothetical protein